MASSVIGTVNRVITATLTTGSNSPSVANLKLPYGGPSYGWSTAPGVVTNAGGAWFTLDSLNSAATWQAFSLHRTNLSASAAVTIWVGPQSTGTAAVYQTTIVQCDPAYQQVVHVAAQPYTGRYCGFRFEDSAALGGNIQVGLCYAGPVLRPGISLDYSSTYGSIGTDQTTVTRAGTEVITPHWQSRIFNAVFTNLSEAEADVVRDIDVDARTGENTLLVPLDDSPNVHRESIYGRMRLAGNVGYAAPGDPTRSLKFTITERVG